VQIIENESESGPQGVTVSLPPHSPLPRLLLLACSDVIQQNLAVSAIEGFAVRLQPIHSAPGSLLSALHSLAAAALYNHNTK